MRNECRTRLMKERSKTFRKGSPPSLSLHHRIPSESLRAFASRSGQCGRYRSPAPRARYPNTWVQGVRQMRAIAAHAMPDARMGLPKSPLEEGARPLVLRSRPIDLAL